MNNLWCLIGLIGLINATVVTHWALTNWVLMFAIIDSTFSIVVSSGLNESALDLERPIFADEGRDRDNPLILFLFGVPRSLPEKRLALRGRILCCPVERVSCGDNSLLSLSPSTEMINTKVYVLLYIQWNLSILM